MSSSAEKTDTTRLAHGRVRKKSRMYVPPPREAGGGVCVSTMRAQSTDHLARCKAPFGFFSARRRLDLTLDPHSGGCVHVDIAEGSAHQGDVGRHPVGDCHLDVAPGGASAA